MGNTSWRTGMWVWNKPWRPNQELRLVKAETGTGMKPPASIRPFIPNQSFTTEDSNLWFSATLTREWRSCCTTGMKFMKYISLTMENQSTWSAWYWMQQLLFHCKYKPRLKTKAWVGADSTLPHREGAHGSTRSHDADLLTFLGGDSSTFGSKLTFILKDRPAPRLKELLQSLQTVRGSFQSRVLTLTQQNTSSGPHSNSSFCTKTLWFKYLFHI